MKYKLLKLLYLTFLSQICFAQVSDNFSDGDFTTNPSWLGDTDLFIVEDQVLRLNAPKAGTSQLVLPSESSDSTIWEFYFLMDFSPSGSNQLQIWLNADQANLNQANGYYVEIGESGDTDHLSFYKKADGQTTKLWEGPESTLGTEPALARIRVERFPNGTWNFYSNYSASGDVSLEGSITDLSFLSSCSSFFGFHCSYTATRADKFYFDDITIQSFLSDMEGPELLSVTALNEFELELKFSELLDLNNVDLLDAIRLEPGSIAPVSVAVDAEDQKNLQVLFESPFNGIDDYSIVFVDLIDLCGNKNSANFSFSLEGISQASYGELLINEIFSDISPSLGVIPSVEWIEIYNNSTLSFQLNQYQLQADPNPSLFPEYLLEAGSFAIICSEEDVAALSPFGNVIGLADFPNLKDDGEAVKLLNKNFKLVHGYEYSKKLFPSNKSDGGWSLERIDANDPCIEEDNWAASVDLRGGTPGTVNSVSNDNSIDRSFNALYASYISENEIQLNFSKALGASFLADWDIDIEPSLAIDAFNIDENDAAKLQVIFGEEMEEGVVYQMQFNSDIFDCDGNAVSINDTIQFGIPQEVIPFDIVINEILYHPATGGVDFVELYNRSNKIIAINDLQLANLDPFNPKIENIESERLFLPNDYLMMSEFPPDIKERYNVKNEDAIFVFDLPSFPTETGNVSLLKNQLVGTTVIDSFNYHDDLHYQLLDKTQGISLERINFDELSNDANWHSAASLAGNATPGYKNSQFNNDRIATNEFIKLNSKSFSPDGDGFEDFLLVEYELEKPGYTGTLTIYDAVGRKIKTIVNNELLGLTGTIKWDGITNDGNLSKMGIYIVVFSVFHADGNVKRAKQSCYLAKILD